MADQDGADQSVTVTPSFAACSRGLLASSAVTLWIVGCGGSGAASARGESSQSAPYATAAEEAEHAEAIDLVAAWLALAGIGDDAAMSEVRADDFTYRESRADDPEPAAVITDSAAAIRACGDPELHVVEGGYDVEMFVQVVRSDDTLAWGRRRLTLRGIPGELAIRTDEFRVAGERRLPDVPRLRAFHGVECDGPTRRPSDCVVIFEEGEAPRRLDWPPREERGQQ